MIGDRLLDFVRRGFFRARVVFAIDRFVASAVRRSISNNSYLIEELPELMTKTGFIGCSEWLGPESP